MFKELMYKLFGLEDLPCPTCEVYKEQLEVAHINNRILLDKLTTKEVTPEPVTAPVPPSAMPHSIPWRVKRQMLEADDRKAALLKAEAEQRLKHIPTVGANTIDGIEQEVLGVRDASEIR